MSTCYAATLSLRCYITNDDSAPKLVDWNKYKPMVLENIHLPLKVSQLITLIPRAKKFFGLNNRRVPLELGINEVVDYFDKKIVVGSLEFSKLVVVVTAPVAVVIATVIPVVQEEKKSLRNKRILRIGIDFGGVLSIHDRKNTTGREHKSTSLNMPGALEALETLKAQGHSLVLISFCGTARARETEAALHASSVASLFEEIRFVKNRLFKKDVIMELDCNIMIDDTDTILLDIAKHIPQCELILFETGTKSAKRYPKWHANGWAGTLSRIAAIHENK